MKKFLKIISILFVLILFGIGIMFSFKICPPQGPWIMPPWCKKIEITVTDYKKQAETISFNSGLNQDFIFGANMMDTWGKNYNFRMFENTRNNIDSAFARVNNLGAQEVYVHDFYMAEYKDNKNFFLNNLDYKFVPEIFGNDMRDEAMSQDDLNKLAKSAHEKKLKIGWRLNLHYVNIGKYLTKLGAISDDVESDRKQFDQEKTEAWVNNFFVQYKILLIDRAKALQKAGFDYMFITPSFMNPKFHPYEKLANEKWLELIDELKGEFKGEIGVILDPYGFVDGYNNDEDWTKYDFYKKADLINFPAYNLLERFRQDDNNLREQFQNYFSFLNSKAEKENIKLGIGFYCSSFDDAARKNVPEFNDILNQDVKSLVRDDDYQNNCYEAGLEALRGKNNINRFQTGNYWWDDAMDSGSASTRISISPSIRNKSAEALFAKWALSEE